MKLAEHRDHRVARQGMTILALSDPPVTNGSVRKRLFAVLRRAEDLPVFLEKVRVGGDKKDAWIKFLLEILQTPPQYSDAVLSAAQRRLATLVGPADPAMQNEQELGLPITGLT